MKFEAYRKDREKALLKMKSTLTFVLFAFLSAVNLKENSADATVVRPTSSLTKSELKVFYEADCPDSIHFILRQLKPTYRDLGEYMNVRLYPYGKASERFDKPSDRWIFNCQHGAHECEGNLIASCVNGLYNSDPAKVLPFVFCQEAGNPVADAEKCATDNHLDWNRIRDCKSGKQGNDFQHKDAEATPQVSFIPHMMFNGNDDSVVQDKARNDLKGLVCGAIPDPKPETCN